MTPGPDQIIACPRCEKYAKYWTLLSGNTFNATLWSDGKFIAPMWPKPPAVVKCHHCSECYWLSEAREITEDNNPFPSQDKIPYAQEPTEEEYYQAIKGGLTKDIGQEKFLRILAWWRSNDAFRGGADISFGKPPREPGAWADNLESLLSMLGKDGHEAIMKAEVLRELGKFEQAHQILSNIPSSRETKPVIDKLKSLCSTKDTYVRALDAPDIHLD